MINANFKSDCLLVNNSCNTHDLSKFIDIKDIHISSSLNYEEDNENTKYNSADKASCKNVKVKSIGKSSFLSKRQKDLQDINMKNDKNYQNYYSKLGLINHINTNSKIHKNLNTHATNNIHSNPLDYTSFPSHITNNKKISTISSNSDKQNFFIASPCIKHNQRLNKNEYEKSEY